MKALVAVGVLIALAPTGVAQTPVRDQPRLSSTGTASVTGIVVADDGTRAPLRRATMTLTRASVQDTRLVATGDDGRFVFDRVPAGSYTLSASKGAYIPMDYGAPKPGMPGSVIALAEGQSFTVKPIALIRGAVIAGRLTDRTGQPVTNVRVRAEQFLIVNGQRRPRATVGATGTDFVNAHGEYRIFGLLPGEYLVSATAAPFGVQGEATAAELRWASQPNGPAPPPARTFTPAPTMFPGTTDAAAGVAITVGRGEERLGVDFPVQYVPVAHVTGTVTSPDGRPVANALVLCTPKEMGELLAPSGVPISRTGPDGAFSCPSLAPGIYLLGTRYTPPSAIPPPSPPDPATRSGVTLGQPVPPLWAMAEVNVAGQDVSNVSLRLQDGLIVSGQIVLKSASAPAASDFTRFLLRLTPVKNVSPMTSPTPAIVAADGTFQVLGVMPGAYRMTTQTNAVSGSGGWSMRSAMLAGKDIADVPVEIGQNISGLVVTLTDSPAELSGSLTDAAGRPSPQLYVLVFPADKALWGTGSRRVQSVRSTENGSYRITGLPPGDYYLCALTELETTLQSEPSYLEQFVPSAIKITLGDGEKKAQSLRIGG